MPSGRPDGPSATRETAGAATDTLAAAPAEGTAATGQDPPRSGRAYAALFGGALLESTIFPWPIEFVLAAMMLENRRNVLPVTAIAIAGSVIGGVIFYVVGALLYDSVGAPLVASLGMEEAFAQKRQRFQDYSVWIIFIAAQTPVPFQITTMAAGVAGVAFWPFLIAAFLARTVRYAMMGVALYFFGPAMRQWWRSLHSIARTALRGAVFGVFVFALIWPFL